MSHAVVITVYLTAVAFLLGLAIGSFVNCWAWRYVRGESVARGRSHCTACGHELAARDLVPVLSWLACRGRCRYCGQAVSARYPLTEVVAAVAFAAIAAVYGLSAETAELLAFAAILLFLSLVDVEERIIPNGCILAALAVRAAYLAHACATGLMGLPDVGFYVASGMGMGLALVVVTLVADRVFGRESMGGGDLKLFAVAGFYFGWQQGLFLVIAACLIGLVAAAVAMALPGGAEGAEGAGGQLPRAAAADPAPRAAAADPAPEAAAADDGDFMRRTIPFGPSIAAACVLAMLVGNPLISWYLGLL